MKSADNIDKELSFSFAKPIGISLSILLLRYIMKAISRGCWHSVQLY